MDKEVMRNRRILVKVIRVTTSFRGVSRVLERYLKGVRPGRRGRPGNGYSIPLGREALRYAALAPCCGM